MGLPNCLCRSLALLPRFSATTSSIGLSDAGICSSVLTSLAVGVPLVVPAAFLQAYPMLKEEHVIVLVSVHFSYIC